MIDKDLGFNQERMIVISGAELLGEGYRSFREDIKGLTGVENVVSSSSFPGRNNNHNRYRLEGKNDEPLLLWTNYVDYDFLDAYGIRLLEGRGFNETFMNDAHACILNESAIREFGITDRDMIRIIPGRDSNSMNYLKIIGVVQDFNTESLHNRVQPYIFRLQGNYMEFLYLTVRLAARDYAGTIADIEKIWKEHAAGKPLKYSFLDDYIGQMYIREKQNARIAMVFSVMSIFIAALGLFGLTSLTVEQRTKEIGIRKAMGSSVAGVYFEISGEIIVLISLASIIAFPVIYYLAVKWLESFYYRVTMGASIFITGFAVVLGIALLTVSYRIVVAARVNPAQSLKYE